MGIMLIPISVRVAVMLVGLLCFALATNPKVQTLGDRAFFAGLLALLFLNWK